MAAKTKTIRRSIASLNLSTQQGVDARHVFPGHREGDDRQPRLPELRSGAGRHHGGRQRSTTARYNYVKSQEGMAWKG